MPELPKPTRLDLFAACMYIARRVGKRTADDQVYASYCDALCTGALTVYADFYPAPDVERGYYKSNQKVPTSVFTQYGNHLRSAIREDVLPADSSQNQYNRPFYHRFTIATADIDAWLGDNEEKQDIHNGNDNPAKRDSLYITVVEAIIWIAYQKWLDMDRLFPEHFKQEDVFYGSAFSTITSGAQRVGEKSLPYDIGKVRMLNFAQRLADGKTWTDEEWDSACGAHRHSREAMDKCLQNALVFYNLSLPEFVGQLDYSIDYEEEQALKLEKAERELLDAARAHKLAIRGKRRNGNGDIENVPSGFLDRLDYKIALWGNKFIANVGRIDSNTFPQVRQIETTGWHELRVKKEDVLKLWPEQSARDYFNELKYAPEMSAARELKAQQQTPFESLPTPDWRLWAHIPRVALWQAIALSLNADPASLEMYGGFDPDRHGGLSDEFKLRLRVASTNLDDLGIYINMTSLARFTPAFQVPVQLTEFSKWAAGKEWSLPASFPKPVANNAKATPSKGKPKGVGAIDDTQALQKIHAILQEGKGIGVKTACESVAAELEIAESNRPATVDRWRRKYREQFDGQEMDS